MFFFKNPFYQGAKSDHFDGRHFFNPSGLRMPTFIDALKWRLTQDSVKWPNKIDVEKPKPLHINKNATFKITYIGHSSFLLEAHGINILFDPIYSKYAGPLKAKKLKRRIMPSIAFDDLPKIDIVCVSHSHYDHCDISFLKRIYKRDKCQFIVPLGLDKIIGKKIPLSCIEALDWFQKSNYPKIDIYLAPAHHWSCRSFYDKNMTLWGSFIIKKDGKTLFFAGDTGFDSKMFKKIHKEFGNISCALIPIGAYKPRWFMKSAHMDPQEALQTHQLLNSEFSIAMHHRTFPLTDEGPFDPSLDLLKAQKHLETPKRPFITLNEGGEVFV